MADPSKDTPGNPSEPMTAIAMNLRRVGLLLYLAAAVLTAPAFSHDEAPKKAAEWKLAWADEFDGKEIDRVKWDFDIGNGFYDYDANQWISGWGNEELQYYTREPENAFVKDGMLHIRALKESLPRFTVIWDGNGIHSKARLVKEFLAANPSIVAENFPAYMPDLNPEEGVWGYTKYGRLANLAPANTQELRERVDAELRDLKRRAYFLYRFIEHTNLPLQF